MIYLTCKLIWFAIRTVCFLSMKNSDIYQFIQVLAVKIVQFLLVYYDQKKYFVYIKLQVNLLILEFWLRNAKTFSMYFFDETKHTLTYPKSYQFCSNFMKFWWNSSS